MKKETLKKANQLQERIESLYDVNYSTTCNPGLDIESTTLPHTRNFEVNLITADADKLRTHIQKFIANLRKQLQSEFDSLK